MYGTLLVFDDAEKSNADWVNSYYNFIKKRKEISFIEVQKICTDILSSNIDKDKQLGLTTYETKINLWLQKLGIYITKEELRDFADKTVNIWQEMISLAPDAGYVLSELLKTKTLALITNFDHSPHINRVVEKHNLGTFLNPVVISDIAEIKKPDPAIFEIALKETGLKKEEVVFVGDSGDDINGAIAAGIKPVLIRHNHYNDTNVNEGFENVATIYSLSELLD